jgi:hypothetical protein
MSTPRFMFNEASLSDLVRAFVSEVKRSALQDRYGETLDAETDSEITRRVSSAVIHALQVEFTNLGFISVGNPQLLMCDMPHNRHQFKPNSRSKHCASCGADYCDDHPLGNCLKCGHTL